MQACLTVARVERAAANLPVARQGGKSGGKPSSGKGGKSGGSGSGSMSYVSAKGGKVPRIAVPRRS